MGYREFEKDGKSIKTMHAFHKNGWRSDSVLKLLKNIDKTIEIIPENQRFNLFYTLSNFEEGEKARGKFGYCSTLAFDIDGIDYDKTDEYLAIFSDLLNLTLDQMSIIKSGRGFHILINLKTPIKSELEFKKHKPTYNLICGLGNTKLFHAGLPGNFDPVIFEHRRVLRLPNTKNIKKDKPEEFCSILQLSEHIVDFDMYKVAGVEEVFREDQIHQTSIKNYKPSDPEAIFEGCSFMRFARDESDKLTEPQWYAAMTIAARMEDAEKWAHKISENHSGYSPDETDLKLEHARSSTGPRKCSNIETLWEGCEGCVSRATCSSPVQIRPEGEILSADHGYWEIAINKQGEIKYLKPDYDGLTALFHKHHPFVTDEKTEFVMTWNGTYWEEMLPVKIFSFIEKYLTPTPNNQHCKEFLGKLKRLHLRNFDWFTKDIKGYINLKNGVLELSTMTLLAHDMNKGFTYCLPFDYNPSAKAPMWDAFINQMVPCKDSRRIMQEYMGYTLSYTDSAIGQKALILKGDGSNGKSVVVDVFREMIGEKNYATVDMKRVASNPEPRGKIANTMMTVVEELPGQKSLGDEFFKAAVAGGVIDARKLYHGSFEFKCNSKFLISTNYDVNFGDATSSAILRRLLVIPFNVVIPYNKQDRQLTGKLISEISGIFNWALEGLESFNENLGFTVTEEIDKNARAAVEGASAIAPWIAEECELGDANFCSNKLDLYESFKMFHEDNAGVSRNMTRNKFSMELKKYLKTFKNISIEEKRTRVNGSLTRTISHIKLIEGGYEAF